MRNPTQRLMELAAAGHTTYDREGLICLLREGHQLYHAGLEETSAVITDQQNGTPLDEILRQCLLGGMPPPSGALREEAIGTLAYIQWEQTPAALAYVELVEVASLRGVSLVPE